MSTILYAVGGDGFGHATRCKTVVDALRGHHDFHVFTSGKAYRFLNGQLSNVHRVPGLRNYYTERGRISYLRTAWNNLRLVHRRQRLVRRYVRRIEKLKPDVLITDFEPFLARAAERLDLPYLSFDHQHTLTLCDYDPPQGWLARIKLNLAKTIVNTYYRNPTRAIVSGFYQFPPRKQNVTVVGPILRKKIMNRRPARHDDVLVYARNSVLNGLLSVLNRVPEQNFIVYVDDPSAYRDRYEPHLTFRKTDGDRFIRDLFRCGAVISTAGNQLVGEAAYARKPILGVPESHAEQRLNAREIERKNLGETCPPDRLTPEVVRSFLGAVTDRAEKMDEVPPGNQRALDEIRSYIDTYRSAGYDGGRVAAAGAVSSNGNGHY